MAKESAYPLWRAQEQMQHLERVRPWNLETYTQVIHPLERFQFIG